MLTVTAQFLWYNDAHLSYSARRFASILKFLQNHNNVQRINFDSDEGLGKTDEALLSVIVADYNVRIIHIIRTIGDKAEQYQYLIINNKLR